MPKLVKFSGVLICGTILFTLPALAQGVPGAAANPGGAANPYAASPATPMETRAQADVTAASANAAGMGASPVVNAPDPHNAGTLAEMARTTAIADYP